MRYLINSARNPEKPDAGKTGRRKNRNPGNPDGKEDKNFKKIVEKEDMNFYPAQPDEKKDCESVEEFRACLNMGQLQDKCPYKV